jgi:hypothetical protein
MAATEESFTLMQPEGVNRGPDWELYAAHREKFTQAVLSVAPSSPGRLCVLGAGKCNDLELATLAEAYRELHLVDLDPAALASAVSREVPSVRRQLFPHAPVDLAVLSPKRAAKWRRRAPNPNELGAAAESALHGVSARLPGPFDVVVSACVLTQLGFALTQSFPEAHPLLGALRQITLETHLRELFALKAPEGAALFVCDLASSTHYPGLASMSPDADIAAVARDIVASRAFYQIARPELIADVLRDLAEREPSPLTPWLWTGPLDRVYLVYGYEIRG